MLTLEEFYANYVKNNVNESEMFNVNYDDSGITKIIKKFLNWFLGSTEKEIYNPYSNNWNEDGTRAKLKEVKNDGEKIDMSFEEIPNIEDFRAAINKANGFLNLKQLFYNKSSIRKFKDYKFGAVHCDVKSVCDSLPIIYFMYKYEKEYVKVTGIEAINSYGDSLVMKDFTSKLKSFLKKQVKTDGASANMFLIKFIRLNSKASWSFEKLLEYAANDKAYTRNHDLEQDKDLERIYTGKL